MAEESKKMEYNNIEEKTMPYNDRDEGAGPCRESGRARELYRIREIAEADYGCEERGPEGPPVLLLMEEYREGPDMLPLYAGTGGKRTLRKEVPEAWIESCRLKEGSLVCLDQSAGIRKAVRVVAAVICDGDRVFATQRGYGAYKDWWEFPGGKIEPGESPQQALVREIREELDIEIRVGDLIRRVWYDYPEFLLSMDCFRCGILSGRPVLLEHEASCWLTLGELDRVDWLPADRLLVRQINSV